MSSDNVVEWFVNLSPATHSALACIAMIISLICLLLSGSDKGRRVESQQQPIININFGVDENLDAEDNTAEQHVHSTL
jgi:hypothetical protein